MVRRSTPLKPNIRQEIGRTLLKYASLFRYDGIILYKIDKTFVDMIFDEDDDVVDCVL
jgi:hypothetical protein